MKNILSEELQDTMTWTCFVTTCILQTLMVLFVPDRKEDMHENRFLTLDPNVTGVFKGPYPLGIDPVSRETRDW